MNVEFSLNQMVKQQIRAWDVLDPRVLRAMTEIPRNRFVPLAYQSVAFAEHRIPLGHNRDMLSPSVAGRILQSLDVQPTDTVLEIGTGSGYLTACLAHLAKRVVSLDTLGDFIAQASQRCEDLALKNVSFEQRSNFAPDGERRYDVVVFTGSLPELDPGYLDLLNPGGRLFVVVGDAPVMTAQLATRVDASQTLTRNLFETTLPRLAGLHEPDEFDF
ncbi:MAG: protein-L-isoaspartate O-methyltransferase [Pseudomonadota bacterium]